MERAWNGWSRDWLVVSPPEARSFTVPRLGYSADAQGTEQYAVCNLAEDRDHLTLACAPSTYAVETKCPVRRPACSMPRADGAVYSVDVL